MWSRSRIWKRGPAEMEGGEKPKLEVRRGLREPSLSFLHLPTGLHLKETSSSKG